MPQLSQAVGHGGVVYLSGAVPGDRSGDVAAQVSTFYYYYLII
jgi:enamine deaminase RidA (YjgF/YER057c/UK114 family)